MAKLVSSTYGDALFAVAVESDKIDVLYEQVQQVAQILREHTDLNRLMMHPNIDKDEKVSMIETIFAGRVCEELVGLLCMIVEKNHYKELDSVFSYFTERVREHKNIGTAYVTSAMEMTPEQKKAVEQKLLSTTAFVSVEVHYAVDPALIGGMVIRIRDRVVDGSVRTKLHHLTRELSNIRIYENSV